MNTALTELQLKVWDILSGVFIGSEITGRTLLVSVGVKSRGHDGAAFRSIIHALRVKGYPICANKNGYYVATTSQEMKEYCDTLGNRIRMTTEALAGLKMASPMLKMKRQTKVWDL